MNLKIKRIKNDVELLKNLVPSLLYSKSPFDEINDLLWAIDEQLEDIISDKKYYFITYQASHKDGGVSVWNDVCDVSPMEYIKRVEKVEEEGDNKYYKNFVVLNTIEISVDEFNTYDGFF